jgi:hypothetical protein
VLMPAIGDNLVEQSPKVTKLERIRDAAGAERWFALASKCVRFDHPGLSVGSLEEILGQLSGEQRSARYAHFVANPCIRWRSLGTQLSGVTASNLRRTSDVSTPRAPKSTAAGSGSWSVRIWASTCWAVT